MGGGPRLAGGRARYGFGLRQSDSGFAVLADPAPVGGRIAQEPIDDAAQRTYFAPMITGRRSFVNYFTPSP
jgi:hypothetical protein